MPTCEGQEAEGDSVLGGDGGEDEPAVLTDVLSLLPHDGNVVCHLAQGMAHGRSPRASTTLIRHAQPGVWHAVASCHHVGGTVSVLPKHYQEDDGGHSARGPLANARPSRWQITYSAISDQLRDKVRFPAMLRTVPSANHHVEAMVQLMIYFRWNWIAVLISADDYGRDNSQVLSNRLARSEICIAFQEVLPTPEPNQPPTPEERERLGIILQKLRQSSARVVVIFSPELSLHNFFREVRIWNFSDIVWIASESWAIDPNLHKEMNSSGTFLGLTIQSVSIPGFSSFRVRRSQNQPPPLNRTTCNQDCDNCLNTTVAYNTVLTQSGERVVFSVYAAVYAVAHALHSFLRCNQNGCKKDVVYPWQVRAPRSQQVQALQLPWRR